MSGADEPSLPPPQMTHVAPTHLPKQQTTYSTVNDAPLSNLAPSPSPPFLLKAHAQLQAARSSGAGLGSSASAWAAFYTTVLQAWAVYSHLRRSLVLAATGRLTSVEEDAILGVVDVAVLLGAVLLLKYLVRSRRTQKVRYDDIIDEADALMPVVRSDMVPSYSNAVPGGKATYTGTKQRPPEDENWVF